MRKLAPILLLLPFSAGCNVAGYGEFGILAPDYDDASNRASIEVLAEDVVGRDCVPVYLIWMPRQPSYTRAVAEAIGKVPGANVMRSATFDFQDLVFATCVRVRGDVGRLQ